MIEPSQYLTLIMQQFLFAVVHNVVLVNEFQSAQLASKITFSEVHLRKSAHPNTTVQLEICDIHVTGRAHCEDRA